MQVVTLLAAAVGQIHRCGINFSAPGTRELNLDTSLVSNMDRFCDALSTSKTHGRLRDITLYEKSNEDLRLQLSTRLGESQVTFDLYAEMFHTKSTNIELNVLDVQWFESLKDYLVDLTGKINVEHVAEKWLIYDTEGRLLGVPDNPNQITMYYRKDLFDKWGRTWQYDTWENFEETLLYIQEKEREDRRSKGISDDFWGFTIPTDTSANRMTYMLMSLLSGHDGGEIVDRTGKVTINNPNAIRTINRWAGWFKDGPTRLASQECFGQSTGGARRFFLADKSAAIIVWSSGHSRHMNEKMAANSSWVIRSAPIPGPNSAGCSGAWSAGLSVHTREKEAALEVLQMQIDSYPKMANTYSGREPFDKRVIANKTLWAEYCHYNPVICKSYEEYPDFWKRLSFRPSAGCGSMYPQCATIIYNNMYKVFTQGVSGADCAKSMEGELNLLLGHIKESDLNKKTGEWETTSRIALLAVAAVGGIILFVLIGIVFKQSSRMRTTNSVSIPISAMLALVATIALCVVLSIVISDMDSNTRSISEDLSGQVRVQSLRTVKATLLGIVDGLYGTTSRKTIMDNSVAKMKTDLGQMGLDRRTLVVLLDRNYPNTVLATSDRRKQKDRVRILETPEDLHPWTKSILTLTDNWMIDTFEATNTVEISSGGEKVYVNMLSVDYYGEESDRELGFLIAYFTPEVVIMEEADQSREASLNYAILMSISAIVLIIACTVLITAPLATLAIDMEYVRNMEMESVSNGGGSALMEIQSLLTGFKCMCDMLVEYKAYLPKSVFIESDSASQEATSATEGDGRSSVSKTTHTHTHTASMMEKRGVAQKANMMEVNKTKDVNGAFMVFRIQDAEKMMCDADAANKVANIIQIVEECATAFRGTMHPMSTRSPSEVCMSWGYVSADCDATVKAAKCAFALRSKNPYSGGNVSFCIASGKSKVGNLGTASTRGFGVLGQTSFKLHLMMPIGNALAAYASCIIVDDKANERLSDFMKVPIDRIADHTGKKLTIVRELKGMAEVENEEWMYQLQSTGGAEGCTLVSCFDLIVNNQITEAITLLEAPGATDDYSAKYVLECLRSRDHPKPPATE
eukprot:TRINITY_DN744_c0_g1_i1.p1 TRINITY_DN744_c0_g1~~TRINITY_DN744_c0_g1_i1.p1  ORF type:complete len:1111 (+),score=183.83 TRINITY_DN744_c0_g1_i1:73-3333(+)